MAYQKVHTKPMINGGANRLPASCVVEKSGRTLVRISAAEKLRSLAKAAGVDPDTYQVAFSADATARTVTVTPVGPRDPDGVPARQYEQGVTIHMGGVFEEHPELVPTGRRECTMFPDRDADGRECLAIGLNTGVVAKRSGRKSKSGDSTESTADAAPAKTAAAQTAPAKTTPANAPAASAPANNAPAAGAAQSDAI